jgi:uncharacterized membrane protein HdeD (DUF308 family)
MGASTMTNTEPHHELSGWGWVMAFGAGEIALAIAAFAWPVSASITASILAGLFVSASGVLALLAASRHRGDRRTYDRLFGVLSLLVGLYLLLAPANGAISLTVLIAIWLGARGLLELYWGFSRVRHGRGWLIAMGLINVILMVWIVSALPVSGLILPGTVLAISLLIGGIGAIAAALAMRDGHPLPSAA